jgi:hypothetical protein
MTSLDDLRESPTQIAELIGAPVRVDLVKESKAVPIFGNFYTWDPESHSVVLAKFHSKGLLSTIPKLWYIFSNILITRIIFQ